MPTAAYITYNLMDDETPKTPFLENIGRKKAARPAIIVQEELKRVYVSQIFKDFRGVMGGFQLEFVSISQVINHMTCYNLSALID